jgi:hypothetical protein
MRRDVNPGPTAAVSCVVAETKTSAAVQSQDQRSQATWYVVKR